LTIQEIADIMKSISVESHTKVESICIGSLSVWNQSRYDHCHHCGSLIQRVNPCRIVDTMVK
jgi:rRNA maturation endonuclease Nob1